MDVSRHHRRERRQGGRRHGRTRRQHPVLLPDSRGERHAQSVAGAVDHRRAPHPVSLPVAELRRQAFPGHPRPSGQKCGLPRSHVGGDRADKEIRYNYQHPDGSYAWTKTRYVTKSGKKRFRCEVLDEATGQWSSGRPEGMPLLFNLAAVASVLAAYPATPLLIVEGEKDVNTAGGFGLLATTNADGAGKWRSRGHPNTDQTGSSKGRRLPRQ